MSQDPIPTTPPPPRKPVVLLVEDEAMVSEVVCAMLKLGGFDAVHALGPTEALDLLRRPEFSADVLLTDYRMPQMTGLELIRHCRALRPTLKTILYSGNVDDAAEEPGGAKPDRFLRKPFTPGDLTSVVRSLIPA